MPNNLTPSTFATESKLVGKRVTEVPNKADTKKVVGYLSNLIPLEVIHAAGALPLMLCGNPDEEPTLANEFMEAAFDPITRSVFNRILKGDYDYLDLILLPRGHDSYQRLYYYLKELQRKHPQIKIPPVYLVDFLYSQKPSTIAHNLKILNKLIERLHALTGVQANAEQLAAAITTYNDCRGLLKDFNQLRADKVVSSEVAYKVYATVQTRPIAKAIDVLTQLNQEITSSDQNESSQATLILVGNSVDHPALHQLIDKMDARVVGDYHAYGQHFLTGFIDSDTDGKTAIVNHYSRAVPGTRTPPPDVDGPTTTAKQQAADGLLFFFLQGEEALTWQVPKQRQRASAAGLACKVFYDQMYSVNSRDFETELRNFIQPLQQQVQA